MCLRLIPRTAVLAAKRLYYLFKSVDLRHVVSPIFAMTLVFAVVLALAVVLVFAGALEFSGASTLHR